MLLSKLNERLQAHGLRTRGAFHPGADDEAPPMKTGRLPATIVLVGNAGGEIWPAFSGSPEYRDELPDKMDRWARRVLRDIAAEFNAEADFPFGGPPYRPFQRWALRADEVWPSPLGLLIHAEFGLWHAYRGAILLPDRIEPPAPSNRVSPCETCADRPCLKACPVGAFTGNGYDVDACAGHLGSTHGGVCMTGSCLARRVCPVGRGHRYEPAQSVFHMQAFLHSRHAAGAP